jgi:hypothetical protein
LTFSIAARVEGRHHVDDEEDPEVMAGGNQLDEVSV